MKNEFILPINDRSLLTSSNYFFNNSMEATRGCINSRDFCTIRTTSPVQAVRNIDNIREELEHLRKYILFLDPNHISYPVYNSILWKKLKRLNKK